MQPANPNLPDPAALLQAAVPGEPGAAWQLPGVAALAPKFPELAIEECIGQGGMAAVYRAVQRRLGRPVALKVMRPDLAATPEFTERFVREARALAALSNPHVLAIHDFGERDGTCYLVTEYVDGANLRELMQLGHLSPTEVLRIVPQICAGLHFAHQHGVVHRDIKPENVLVDREGQVKLADFGLAKLAGAHGDTGVTRSGQVFGTPHYMAPEQWRGSAAVDHRADIYSLGVVLYELLTGRLPIGTYPPASSQPGVPPGIDRVVARSLQQEPAQRYQSAGEVQQDLAAEAADPAVAAATATAAAATPTSATTLLAVTLGLLVCGAGALLLHQANEDRLGIARYQLMARNERNASVMADIVATVARGEAWQGDALQPLPASQHAYELAGGLARLLPLAGTGVLAIAVMVLAGAAWRRTRHVGTSRAQHALATVLFALPPFLGAASGLLWLADRTRQTWVVVVAAAACAVAAIAGLVASWRSSAGRLPGTAAPIGAVARGTLAVAGLLLAGVTALAWWGPRHAFAASRHELLPASRFVGLSRVEVLQRLGPPLSVACSPDSMIWGYRGLDGEERTDALQFDRGMVTTSQHLHVVLVPSPRPSNGASAGMTVAELLAALGPATHSTLGENGGGMQFADGTSATISPQGIVTHVTR